MFLILDSLLKRFTESQSPSSVFRYFRLLSQVHTQSHCRDSSTNNTAEGRVCFRAKEEPQERAFQKLKELVQSDTVLTHYDPSKTLLLQCDASPYGLGVVISHVGPDGLEHAAHFLRFVYPQQE